MINKITITNPAEILYKGTFGTSKEVIKLRPGTELILSPIGLFQLVRGKETLGFDNQSINWLLDCHIGSYTTEELEINDQLFADIK